MTDLLARALRGEAYLIFDGGMGTMLQARGLAVPGAVPDMLNFTNPDDVTSIQAEYVAAGANVITANTFSSNRLKLAEQGVSVAEAYAAAVACARAAGAQYVAGDIGPIGTLLEPMGTMSFEEAYDIFAEQARAAEAAGADLIAIETMADLLEAKAAVLAAKTCTDLPVFVSMTFGEDGRTFLGTTPTVAAVTLSSMGADVVGVNCSLGPKELDPIVRQMTAVSRVPVLVQPNAGLPRIVDGETVFDITPQDFVEAVAGMLDSGASVLGGCCGTTPAFIREVAQLVAGRERMPREASGAEAFWVTSAQEAVCMPAGQPAIAVIGERINPTGKKRLRAALLDRNYDYVVGEAVSQLEAGAEILDVNVGVPGIDEPTVLHAVTQKLQATCTAPLQIDSSDAVAVEAAVRSYAGKPLINSVNGAPESLASVLPIVKKYGCSVVGLTLDENGIPATAEERFAIAERIVNAAEEMGIPRCDIAIDCLAMAAATSQKEAYETMRAIQMVKNRLGVRTALGVSNVSFGLPQRGVVNATYLAACFGCGLDLPILNPLAKRYMDTVAAFRVIDGQDPAAAQFVADYADAVDPYTAPAGVLAGAAGVAGAGAAGGVGVTPATGSGVASAGEGAQYLDQVHPDLTEVADRVQEIVHLVLSGRGPAVAEATTQLLGQYSTLAIIDGIFIPALDLVGAKYERGQFFLPQLMASAEAVKAGFDVVKAHSDAMGDQDATHAATGSSASNSPIIIATVKGDIHDIGKNIVKMLLENYGYRVIDLGRDVAPETILDAVRAYDARIVGLSALMTTTVKAMEDTVALLAAEAPEVVTLVGGAVLTPEYAAQIGATYYCKDAAETARIVAGIFAS